MADLVGTCPRDFWNSWIAEGDPAGSPYSGEEWGWFTRSPLAASIHPGERFYVVAHGKLRGWAPVTRVRNSGDGAYCICRRGDAVACTVPFAIPGFRGLRRVWWNLEEEIEFPDWRTP
jgi:hypothetical protein